VQCDEAEDGLQAIEKVRAKTGGRLGDPAAAYAVIIMDFVMPRMDGSAATRQLRCVCLAASIPCSVVMQSPSVLVLL
jgi:CheY-like chemotaxis protein